MATIQMIIEQEETITIDILDDRKVSEIIKVEREIQEIIIIR